MRVTRLTSVLLNFTVNADWPGGGGELVVFQTGESVASLGEIRLQSVVLVARLTPVPHRLIVCRGVAGVPGQLQLASTGWGRGVNTVAPDTRVGYGGD